MYNINTLVKVFILIHSCIELVCDNLAAHVVEEHKAAENLLYQVMGREQKDTRKGQGHDTARHTHTLP